MLKDRLSVVIVNYRSVPLIQACLASIVSFSKEYFEIIVVDNSGDDPANILEQFPMVKWIPMGYNAGFARANNRGIQLAKGDVVLLLNPDIIAEDDAISQCYQRFVNSDYIACGVQLLNADRTPQVSGSYFMTGGLNHLLPLPFLGNLFKWLGQLAKIKKTSLHQAPGPVEVDWINGACLMVKKAAAEKAGLLDEDFFLYFEEIEWCSRLRRQGRLCLYGDLHLIHLQGATANDAFASEGKGYYNLFDRKGRQILVSGMVRIRKQFGAGWFFFHLLACLADVPVFFFGWMLQAVFFQKPSYSFRQFRGFCANLFYLLPLVPGIVSNRNYFYKAL